MNRDIRVAAVNMESRFGDPQANMARVADWAERLSPQAPDIICFPELCLTGYGHSAAMDRLCQPIPGPATRELVALAAACDTNLVVGLAEIGADGKRYIAQVVATPTGLAGVYRKAHLSPTEQPYYAQGSDLGIVDLDCARLGLQLCYDTHFGDWSALQALSGATVLCAGFASPRDAPSAKAERLSRYLCARAYDNSCYLVASHLVGITDRGKPLAGVALVIDPKGCIVSSAVGWQESYVLQTLSAHEVERLRVSRMGCFLQHRRAELYAAIERGIHLDQEGAHAAS